QRIPKHPGSATRTAVRFQRILETKTDVGSLVRFWFSRVCLAWGERSDREKPVLVTLVIVVNALIVVIVVALEAVIVITLEVVVVLVIIVINALVIVGKVKER